jgi:NADH:ubiquinone oxidoreductase subunit E
LQNFTGYQYPYFTEPVPTDNFIQKYVGDMMKIRCNAAGIPEPNITWTFNKTDISGSWRHRVFEKYDITIFRLIRNDAGSYICKVCNTIGCISHKTFALVFGEILEHIFEKHTILRD